jgi:Trypsin
MKKSLLAAVGLVAGCTGTDPQLDPAFEVDVARRPELAHARRAGDRSGRRARAEWPLAGIADAPQPIVGGTPHSGNPEVGLIMMLDEFDDVIAICSGTLIQPKLVLTAAHCVDGEVPAVGYAVYFGTDAVSEEDPGEIFLTDAESVVFHPDWNPNDLRAGNDIGLIHLVDEVPITPAAIRTQPLTDSDLGAPVHLVGWGITGGEEDDSGIKRHAFSTLDDIEAELVLVGNPETNTCSGDSGGPAFLEVGGVEQVIGITSFGDVDCAEIGVSTRVDVFADFIAANSEPGGGGGFGAPCEFIEDCASGLCVLPGDGGEGFCSASCSGADPCPADFECADLDGTAVCVPASGAGGGGELGDACDSGDDCSSGVCAVSADGTGICTEDCESSLDCAIGFSCEAIEGGSVCLPAEDDDDGGAFPTPIPSDDEGGCSVGTGGGSGLLAPLLALLALVLVRPLRGRKDGP